MGWERKRGKLEEFNRLLRGAQDTSFVVRTANSELLRSIRYVITLDSDTQLPRDVARKLVGAAIHPLNQPQINEATNRVTRGYGILQPRVSIALSSASRSKFVQIFSGYTGIDPYTTAVSDVYQDFFGEGNFTGKGLYDVDAFQTTLENRVPANSLLSHDLFESLFARAALTTDIELLDDYPASYEAYAKRSHRWVRGDWQIMRWLFPSVPDGNGKSSAQHVTRHRALEDPRQSPSQPRRSGVVSVARRFVCDVPRLRFALVALRLSRHRVSGLPARDDGPCNASARHSLDQPLLEPLGRLPHQHRTDRAVVCVPASPGMVDVRRDRARPLSPAYLAKEVARVGVGSGSGKIVAKRCGVVRSIHVAGVGSHDHRDRLNIRLQASCASDDGNALRHLDAFAVNCLLGKQAATGGTKAFERRRHGVCAADRAPHVALL